MENSELTAWIIDSGIVRNLDSRRCEIISTGSYDFAGVNDVERLLSEMWLCRGLENTPVPGGFTLRYTFVEIHRDDGICAAIPHYYYEAMIDGQVWVFDPVAGQFVDYMLDEPDLAKVLHTKGDRMKVLRDRAKGGSIRFIQDNHSSELVILYGCREEIATCLGIYYTEVEVK